MVNIHPDARAYLEAIPFMPSISLIRAVNRFCNSEAYNIIDKTYDAWFNYSTQSKTSALINWAKLKPE